MKRTSFELGVLITHAFLFQVFNATYNLEATWYCFRACFLESIF